MTAPAAGPLTDAQLESFRRDGFVILDGVLPAAPFEDLITTMLHLTAAAACPTVKLPDFSALDAKAREALLLESLLALEKADHDYIRGIHDVVRETPALNRLGDAPALCGAVNQLMGRPQGSPLYPLQRSCRMDMPQDTAFFLDWHQEVHYTFKDADLIQLWAPVTDVDLSNGALRVLTGSHKAGVAQTKDTLPEFGHAQYTVVPEVVARYPEKVVTMKRGSALLFDKMLIHKSGVNSSARPRLTMITHYHNAARPGFPAHIKPPKAVKNPYAS